VPDLDEAPAAHADAVADSDTVVRRWRAVTPPRALWIAVPHTRRGQSRLVADLDDLPIGTSVVLYDGWLFSRARCRKLASRCSILVAREYLALPTLAGAVALLQDEPGTARYLAANLLSAPPTPTLRARVQEMLIPVARRAVCGRWRSVVFAGRVVLGTRT
jgi:hypothetical protein